MQSDIKKIKKLYGERFYKDFIRPNFSHLIERESFCFIDLLKKIIAPSNSLIEDMDQDYGDFDDLLYAIYDFALDENYKPSYIKETPRQLMKKAGYKLYRCRTVESVERFRKYYTEDELICTFNDIEGRLEEHDVFFAVKEGAEDLCREDFKNPQRQDEYGTSVISIQFNKLFGCLSIKNRYNHSVLFPDATFCNNLDNIIKGLTDSFYTHYKLGIVTKSMRTRFYLRDHYQPSGEEYEGGYGPQYRIINEFNGIVYSNNNIIIKDEKVFQYDTARYILANYYLIDIKERTIKLIDDRIEDDFIKHFDNIQKIDVTSGENGERNIYIHQQDKQIVEIRIDKCNRIISVKDPNVEKIGDKYMQYCQNLKEIEFERLTEVGDDFIAKAVDIKKIVLNKLVRVGDGFLHAIPNIYNLSLPKLEVAGKDFLKICARLESLYVPKLEQVGEGSLHYNPKMEEASFESLRIAPADFLARYEKLERLYLPMLEDLTELPEKVKNLLTEDYQT